MMRFRLVLLLSSWLAMLAAGIFGVSTAQAASCQFVLGFATLESMIPQQVGQCLENEQHNPANGDGLQHTTGGLLVWRKADNHTAFTNGSVTWVNGPHGLQERLNGQHFAWEGAGSGAGPTLVTPDPVQLLQDYYRLIDRRAYSDAYALWSNPPSPYLQFVAGYATTATVEAAFGTPEGNSAAGHLGVDIPTVLVAHQTDGSIQSYAGCYLVVRLNPALAPAGAPTPPWMLQQAAIHALPGVTSLSDPAAQAALTGPCPGHTSTT
ncbi:MAG TPA: hypothetical protein VGP33_10255 [Chloroflexota bacterium]|nr:hypothetical protein [Chloroflexota bacterium]